MKKTIATGLVGIVLLACSPVIEPTRVPTPEFFPTAMPIATATPEPTPTTTPSPTPTPWPTRTPTPTVIKEIEKVILFVTYNQNEAGEGLLGIGYDTNQNNLPDVFEIYRAFIGEDGNVYTVELLNITYDADEDGNPD